MSNDNSLRSKRKAAVVGLSIWHWRLYQPKKSSHQLSQARKRSLPKEAG